MKREKPALEYTIEVNGFKLYDPLYFVREIYETVSGDCLVCGDGSGKLYNKDKKEFKCFHCNGTGRYSKRIDQYVVDNGGHVAQIILCTERGVLLVEEERRHDEIDPRMAFKTHEEANVYRDTLNKVEIKKFDKMRRGEE